MRRTAVIAGLALVCAMAGCGDGKRAADPSQHFIPYVDVATASSALPAEVRQSGVSALALGFVVAAGHRCQAGWGGGSPISDPAVTGTARRVLTIVSFGGRDGPDLAGQCTNPGALAAQYEHAVEAADASGADFDIEHTALGATRSLQRRARAIAVLQHWAERSGRKMSISLTLPAAPSGLTPQALGVVRSAVAAGVREPHVNLLAMDFGDSTPAGTPGRMARYVIASALHAAEQLRGVLPAAEGTNIWPLLGITAMIGRNDTASELFTPQDAGDVLRFARAHRVGWLSYWSLSRDRSCPRGVDLRVAQDACSGLAQGPFRFTRLFAGYAG